MSAVGNLVTKHLPRIVVLSLAFFAVALLIATIAFGTDMDQLASRSVWSRGAAAIHNVLWLPHDSALRAIPNSWRVRITAVSAVAVVINSLAWGAVLYAAWRGIAYLRRRPRGRRVVT